MLSIHNILQECYKKEYITKRDGNACQVYGSGYLVTESGVDKSKRIGAITVDANGQAEYPLTPSIETMAHIYALKNTNKTHSLHVHPPYTIALLNLYVFDDAIVADPNLVYLLGKNVLDPRYMSNLLDYPELTRYTKVGIPVDSYPSGSDELHKALDNSFKEGIDLVPMHKHGVMAVGKSFDECLEAVERMEHVSKIILLGL